MDNKEFKKNALRTESNNFEKIRARLHHKPVAVALFNKLGVIAKELQELDQIKKYLFYGKEAPYLVKFEQESFGMLKAGFPVEVERYITKALVLIDSEKLIRVLHSVVGMNTESGELIEALIKACETNGEIDVVNFKEEIGDVNWYEAVGADALGFEVDDANEAVIKKLKNRFPNKFDESHAINRDLKTERETLEGNS